jgi:ankyrin repeat protein
MQRIAGISRVLGMGTDNRAAAAAAPPRAAAVPDGGTKYKPGGGRNVKHKWKMAPTPLHRACLQGKPAVVRKLLGEGADVHARFSDGEAPLHQTGQAIRSQGFDPVGAVECARLLLAAGADPNAMDDSDISALACAAFNGLYDVCKVMLEGGAKDVGDYRGRHAWEKARDQGHERVAKLIRECPGGLDWA